MNSPGIMIGALVLGLLLVAGCEKGGGLPEPVGENGTPVPSPSSKDRFPGRAIKDSAGLTLVAGPATGGEYTFGFKAD